jgi:uncharacterized membrane protein YhaH (DUF805 family)
MLFTADGRIRRRDWWLYSTLVVVLSGVLFFVLFFVMAVLGRAKPNDPMAPILGNLYFPLFCWMMVCLASKRWHDRNKSGWFAGIGVALNVFYWVWINLVGQLLRTGAGRTITLFLSFIIAVATIVYGLWVFIECGVLDGTHGANRYGPSPKGLNHEENLF